MSSSEDDLRKLRGRAKSRSDTVRIINTGEKPPTVNRKTGRIMVAKADAEPLCAFLLSASLQPQMIRGEDDPCEIKLKGTPDWIQIERLVQLWFRAVRQLGNRQSRPPRT